MMNNSEQVLARYGQIRDRLWHNITSRSRNLTEAQQRVLLEEEYARSIIETLYPELMHSQEWREPGATLSVSGVGVPREGEGRPVGS